MADKPTTLPEWATAGTNNTEPSAPQKDSGWTPGQDGISDYDNWYKELVYRWCAYLSDGDFDAPIRLETESTGDAVRLEVNNADELELRNGADSAAGNLRAGNAVLSGNLTVSGDAGVVGDVDIDGSITGVSSITMGGVLHRPSRFYMISAFNFLPDYDDAIVDGTDIDHGTNVNTNGYLQHDDPGALTRRAFCGLPVRDGEQIFALILRIREDAAEEVAMRCYRVNYNTGTRTQIGTTQTSANSTDDEFLIILPSEDVDDQHFYWVEVDSTATASSLRIYGLIAQILVP